MKYLDDKGWNIKKLRGHNIIHKSNKKEKNQKNKFVIIMESGKLRIGGRVWHQTAGKISKDLTKSLRERARKSKVAKGQAHI